MSMLTSTPPRTSGVLDTMADALRLAGLMPEEIVPDGELHRCPVAGGKTGAKDGAYIVHMDDPATVWWQNYRTGETDTWTAKEQRQRTPAEQKAFYAQAEALRRAREEARDKRQGEAAETARRILSEAPDCSGHPYLKAKGVTPCPGLKLARDGRLIVPVQGEDGKAISAQFVASDGGKLFLADGRTLGGFFAIKGAPGRLFICEGLATGMSIREATGQTVLCTFSAGNLGQVATEARKRYAKREIVLCADNDHHRPGNPGLAKATAAAKAVNGVLAVPHFADPTGKTDFNDLHMAEGLEVVREQLAGVAKVVAQPVSNDGGIPVPVSFDAPTLPTVDPAALPPLLGDFCSAVAEGLQVPFEMVLINALACVSVAGQKKFKVQVRAGYTEPINIYAMAALPPGERKSATVEVCKRPLMAWEAAAQEDVGQVIKNALSERMTLEKTIEATRTKASKAKTPEDRRALMAEVKALEAEIPEVPQSPRLLIDDVTPEAIPPFLAEHGERAGIIEAEGGLFDILGGRYSKGVPNLDAVLKLWSGEPVHVDRKSGPAIVLNAPALTICLTPQPEIIRGMADKPGFRGRGLVGRFLFLLPRSRVGSREVEPCPIPEAIQEQYAAKIVSLLALPWASDPTGKPTSFHLQIAPDAYKEWLDFYRGVEESLRPGGELELIADWGGKLHGAAVRVAGLLHLVTHDEPHLHPIGLETMHQALNLSRMFTEHAKAAFDLMGTDPDIECAKHILAWLKDSRIEAFQAREAFEKVKGRYPKMLMVKAGLSILEERDFIFADTMQEREPGKAGRSPSPGYTVSPLAYGGKA
ncbi:MAG: DUF3987 domain-containing protein [Proteobacteria bacterium]|nr:DUF3987 domain-containing protein [Pseudomonadota bacterium]